MLAGAGPGRVGKAYGRRRTDREPHRGVRPVIWIAVAVGVLDWSTKALIASNIPLGEMVVVVPDRVAFWHVRNRAMILGLFGDLPLPWRQAVGGLLGLVAAVLLVEVLSRAHRLLPNRRPWAWAFGGLVFGGMLGNLGERVLHWGVTDFLSFRWGEIWLPPGNIADLSIIMAIPIAILVILFEIEARAMRGARARGARQGSAARGGTPGKGGGS